MRSMKFSWVIPWWMLLLCGWTAHWGTTSTHALPSQPEPDVAASSSASAAAASSSDILGAPASSSASASSSSSASSASTSFLAPSSTDLEILTYHIQSLVISRYAVTTITCKIKNPALEPQDAAFSILLPTTAFISNLTIEAGGKNYTSLVREKEEARRTYEKARARGQNTAIAHSKERETSRFRVDVTVADQDEVIFYLTYEELLERRLGTYSHRINVHPGYPVRDLIVDVTIHETREFSSLNVTSVPGGQKFGNAVSEWREGSRTARLQFDPDPEAMPRNGVIHGQLVVQYDVKRALDAGDVQVENGYFVHFFAPNDLQYTPKHITFLIDVSGSMSGLKLQQVKTAMNYILTNLNSGDTFNIIRFSSSAHKLGIMRYSPSTVRRAQKYIEGLEADGGTNIDDGLKVAIEEEVEATVSESIRPHIVVLLTDGSPTTGVTSHPTILKNVRNRNRDKASIFCLGFGRGADMDFLAKLALQNHGTSRKIYEEADAADQLTGFYRELSTPLLLDIQFSYSGDAVMIDTLSKTHFYNYFEGTELTVTGQTEDDLDARVRANITGKGRNGQFFMGVTDWNLVSPPDHHLLSHLHLAPTPPNFIKRLWAFLKVKDLLAEAKGARGQHDRTVAQKKALIIALENHFVTPLTSLVVVQPDQEHCKDYEDDDDMEDGEAGNEVSSGQPAQKGPMQRDDNNHSQSLDSQNSVSHAFNPASIHVLSGEEVMDSYHIINNVARPHQIINSYAAASSRCFISCPVMVLLAILLTTVAKMQVHIAIK